MKQLYCYPETTQQRKSFRKLNSLIKNAKDMGFKIPKNDGVRFHLKFDLKSVASAGMATYKFYHNEMSIRLHKFGLEKYKDKFNRTLIHEFAHILQFTNYPNSKPHGREFKMLMRKLGESPSRCHNYDLKSTIPGYTAKNTFTYRCRCRTFQASKIRHNKILRGHSYICNVCKATIIKA